MNDEGALARRPRPEPTSGFERSTGSGLPATWERVDRVLEVRARIVLALDALEDGDGRLAELALFGLLDDLDAAELLTAKAA